MSLRRHFFLLQKYYLSVTSSYEMILLINCTNNPSKPLLLCSLLFYITFICIHYTYKIWTPIEKERLFSQYSFQDGRLKIIHFSFTFKHIEQKIFYFNYFEKQVRTNYGNDYLTKQCMMYSLSVLISVLTLS